MSDTPRIAEPEAGPLLEMVTRINAARRAVRLYPDGHVSIDTALDGALAAVSQRLAVRSPLTLRSGKQDLMVEGALFRDPNAVCLEFAAALYERHVAAVVFHEGVTRSDLERFVRFLVVPPDAFKGHERSNAHPEIPHILLRSIDYTQVELTVESAVSSRLKVPEADELAFLSNLDPAPSTERDKGPGDAQDRLISMDTDALSEIIDQYRSELDSAVDSYEQQLQHHFSQPVPADGDGAVTERIQALDLFSRKLSPALRQQFLAFDFQSLSSNKRFVDLDRILGEETAVSIFDAIKEANDSDREVSPTLLGLVRRIMTALTDEETEADPSGGLDALGEFLEERPMEELFQREAYEEFVIPAYDRQLKQLSRGVAPMEGGADFTPHLGTFEPSRVETHVVDAAFRLMAGDGLDDGLYRSFGEYLVALDPARMDRTVFDGLSRLVRRLAEDAAGAHSQERRQTAQALLERLRRPEVVKRAVALTAETVPGEEPGKGAEAAFLTALGPPVVPQVLAELLDAQHPRQILALQVVLDPCKEAVIAEARPLLSDPSPQRVRRVVALLGRLGASESTEDLVPLLTHPDRAVRSDALAVMVQLGHEGAVARIRKMIRSRSGARVMTGAQLAGRYEVRACVPDLVSAIRTGCFTRKAIYRNEHIVRALGQIGDPAALPVLKKIAGKSFSWHRQGLNRLKVVLFSSLERYPARELEPFIQMGLAARDSRIRKLAMDLRQAGSGEARSR